MPRGATIRLRQAMGLARLETRLGALLMELPAADTRTLASAHGWDTLLAQRLPAAQPRQLVEATQALSSAWTTLGALQRFQCQQEGSIASAGAVIDFVGAGRAECAMPHAAFRDLASCLGCPVHLRLVGPAAGAAQPGAPVPPEAAQLRIRALRLRYEDLEFQQGRAPEDGPPSLAVALNAGLQEDGGRSWLPAMRRLLDAGVPTVVTGYSREDSVACLACLFAHGLRPRLIFGGRNPFGSLLGTSGAAEDVWQGHLAAAKTNSEDGLQDIMSAARKAAGALEPAKLDAPVPWAMSGPPGPSSGRHAGWRAEWPLDDSPPLCNNHWFGFRGREAL
mmetsp:Transcript_15555/g.44602  ORF Transcript_15555/g.44602 Transcript_15555/m.44602 type:complete len:335 (-) Transcript_15555:241-1245(-)